jgi:hypothetical protein
MVRLELDDPKILFISLADLMICGSDAYWAARDYTATIEARNSALPRSYWIRIHDPVYGLPRMAALGSSVNRGSPHP